MRTAKDFQNVENIKFNMSLKQRVNCLDYEDIQSCIAERMEELHRMIAEADDKKIVDMYTHSCIGQRRQFVAVPKRWMTRKDKFAAIAKKVLEKNGFIAIGLNMNVYEFSWAV